MNSATIHSSVQFAYVCMVIMHVQRNSIELLKWESANIRLTVQLCHLYLSLSFATVGSVILFMAPISLTEIWRH